MSVEQSKSMICERTLPLPPVVSAPVTNARAGTIPDDRRSKICTNPRQASQPWHRTKVILLRDPTHLFAHSREIQDAARC